MYGQSKKLLACWILLGSVLASIGSYGQTPTPTESTDKPKQQATTSQKKPKPDQRGTEKSPLFIKVAPTQKTQEETERETQRQEEVQSTDRWLMRFTGLLAIFTLILAGFTAKTWWDAKKTAERQLRAYVSATPTNMFGPQPIRYRFSMINHGQTPAYHVTDVASVDIFPYPLPANFNFPALSSQKASRTVLHPSATNYSGEAHATRTFTAAEIAQITTGTQNRLYLYGVLQYVDIFNKPHITKFCHSVAGSPAFTAFFQGVGGQVFDSESADQHDETD